MAEAEFDVLLLEAIDEALSALGDSIMQTVYFHVERSFHIKNRRYRIGSERLQKLLRTFSGSAPTSSRF